LFNHQSGIALFNMKNFSLPAFIVLFLSLFNLQAWSQAYVTSNPDSVCAGSTNVVYRIPPVSSNPTSTYNWSISGGGTVIAQANDDSIYVNWSNTPGTDQVRVTEVSGAGCSSPQASIDVVRYRPTATVSGGPFNICAGTTGSISFDVTFTGRAPFSVTYSFTNGGFTIGPFTENNIQTKVHTITIPVPGILAAGTYTGTISAASDKGSCSATTISGNVTLVISQPAAPTASVTVQPSCATPSGSIGVTAPTGAGITYSIGGTYQASGNFTSVAPGTYTVTARDGNGCVSPSTTSVTVNPAPSSPAAPTASVTVQPSCSVATGTIAITAPTGAGIEYSIGGAYQASGTFTGIAPGTYSVTAQNSSGCISPTTSLTVNPQPATPAAPTASVTVQPNCSVAAGTIVITAPAGAGIEYSIGGAYQSSGTFTGVTPGAYNATVRNSSGCISTATNLTVNPAPSSPAAPTASVTVQPTCATATGTLVITAPAGAGIEYSIGGAYQSSGTFTGVIPGTYNVTARNSSGCISSATSLTVNPQPVTPAAPTASVTVQPDCATGTGTIVITAPVGAGITYSIGGAYQASGTFSGLAPGNYTLTAQGSTGCISSATGPLTVNPQPPTPTTPVIQHRN
jgi:hypothetical protein